MDLNRGSAVVQLSLVFQVPGVTRLLSVCGVGASPSDPVTSEDLKSASASYRRALHRAYIRRLKSAVHDERRWRRV